MKRIAASGAALAATLVAAAVLPGGSASARPARTGPFLTTKTPYTPQERLSDYQDPPEGFVPVFAENVVRHGSRAMTDSDDGDAVLAVLRNAQTRHALTSLGTRLAPQVGALLAGGASIGYGNLAGRGKQEQRDIALRMERRMPALFDTIVAKIRPEGRGPERRPRPLPARRGRPLVRLPRRRRGVLPEGPGLQGPHDHLRHGPRAARRPFRQGRDRSQVRWPWGGAPLHPRRGDRAARRPARPARQHRGHRPGPALQLPEQPLARRERWAGPRRR